MIGRLHGSVVEIAEEDATIEAGGVGYQVRCAGRTLARLVVGEVLLVYVESQWSESVGPRLYGFLSREERAMFVALQTIQGVGPKAALAILDVLPPRDLAAAVARGDKAAVARAQGVGPKLAARIVAELEGKPLRVWSATDDSGAAASSPAAVIPPAWGDAMAALVGLGWADQLARRALDQALAHLGPRVEAAVLIKAALRELDR